MSKNVELVKDAFRRMREAIKEGKPTVTLFCCNAEALIEEIEVLREQLKAATDRSQSWKNLAERHEFSRNEALEMVEKLAAAGARLTSLAGGGEVENGDLQFASNDGMFSEHIAHQRILWLLKCEKAMQSMADQICSPKTTAEDMVADILGEPRKKARAAR